MQPRGQGSEASHSQAGWALLGHAQDAGGSCCVLDVKGAALLSRALPKGEFIAPILFQYKIPNKIRIPSRRLVASLEQGHYGAQRKSRLPSAVHLDERLTVSQSVS